ncbi:adenylate/guanylate cyclase domain-containing protein [Alsobacter sp. SYSU BS001988]
MQEIAFAAAAMAQAENWRHGIDELLARLGRAVNVSRVFLFEIDPTPDGKLAHTCRHDWSAPGLPSLGGSPRYSKEVIEDYDPTFDEWIARRRRGELIRGHTRDLTGVLREDFEFQRIVSFISIPIHIDGAWWGHLGFDDCVAERDWATEEIHLLQTTGALIAASAAREKTARSLRAMEALRAAMMDVSLDCILITDGGGRVIDVNPAFEATFGWTRADVLRRSIGSLLFNADSGADWRELFAKASRRGGARGPALRMETTAPRADGRLFPIELTMARIDREDRGMVAIFVRDLTARHQAEARLKEMTQERANLARFFPRNLVEHLIEIDVPLSSAKTQAAAVMFVDMVGFTSFCEDRAPDEIIAVLREMLAIACRIVFRHQGTIYKFTGDGLMAVFGAPMRGVADASRAVSCAMDLQTEVEAWNRSPDRLGSPIEVAVGVHYGDVLFGDVGAEDQLELAVLGDTVNIASRVEGYCRALQTSVLITEATWSKIHEEMRSDMLARFTDFGSHLLRGRHDRIHLFGILRRAFDERAGLDLEAADAYAWPRQATSPMRRTLRPMR